jgi:hypothetical protein
MAKDTKDANGAKGELVKKGDPAAELAALMGSLGIAPDEAQGLEQVQSGGLTKWIDLRRFQVDPEAPREKPVKGGGEFKAFAGGLLGIEEIEVDEGEQGEINADGVKVRYFYNIKLMTPCPVAYKNENKEEVKEIAQPGEIIAVGERHALRGMRELATDGGLYVVVIKPHSRIKVSPTRTMWTFDMWKRTIRPPMKVKAELTGPASRQIMGTDGKIIPF